MKNMVDFRPVVCSPAMMACFRAYMQQTDEQNGLPTFSSLEPTHWMKATFLGVW
ncbi:MAG: hypothetical protein A4E29_00831 [Methanomassiliicoccales archaeon PtaB.Bin134]|nr:MAG: hypothetical protein A4E29_00831 [Methanomassiliicoccales archaeon PtaB.Bin134]